MEERFGRRRDDLALPAPASEPRGERLATDLAPFAAAAGLAALVTPIGTHVDWPLYGAAVALGALSGFAR
ncbi:MAG TPA: hypothetical protein VMS02_06450, partial [Solirubrobacteraceae bacterium]|nr:hypothetical protein [Solirubrobacteraceae bacterium]